MTIFLTVFASHQLKFKMTNIPPTHQPIFEPQKMKKLRSPHCQLLPAISLLNKRQNFIWEWEMFHPTARLWLRSAGDTEALLVMKEHSVFLNSTRPLQQFTFHQFHDQQEINLNTQHCEMMPGSLNSASPNRSQNGSCSPKPSYLLTWRGRGCDLYYSQLPEVHEDVKVTCVHTNLKIWGSWAQLAMTQLLSHGYRLLVCLQCSP